MAGGGAGGGTAGVQQTHSPAPRARPSPFLECVFVGGGLEPGGPGGIHPLRDGLWLLRCDGGVAPGRGLEFGRTLSHFFDGEIVSVPQLVVGTPAASVSSVLRQSFVLYVDAT